MVSYFHSAPNLVSVVPVNPAQAGSARQPPADKQVAAARPESYRHAAIDVVAESAEAREAVAGRSGNSELGIVVLGADRRDGIRIGVALETRAEMEQQRRRDGVVEIPARHLAADALYPDGREQRGQTVHAVRLVGALGGVVKGQLDLAAEVLIDLDRGNLLQLVERSRLGEVIHEQIVADVRLGQQAP